MDKLRVGVILGGMSSEKEVSLNSGRNVFDNLDRELYEGTPVFMDGGGRLWVLPWQMISQNTTTDIEERLAADARRISYEELAGEIDFAFVTLHGKYGDDGCIQGLLELLKIPYTGPGVLASALGMDKHMQQKMLKQAGLDVPFSMVVDDADWERRREEARERISEKFTPPFVVKPIREGSSIGVSIVREQSSLDRAMAEALKWDRAVLVEEFIDGTEYSVIVLEEEAEIQALGVTEIHPQSGYYTYDDKYMPGRCRKFTPPKNIAAGRVEEIKREAVKAFIALGFRSYGRIDGFALENGRILITDPNSSSGMAPSSFFFEQAACAGMLPSVIVSKLIENALRIHNKKTGPL